VNGSWGWATHRKTEDTGLTFMRARWYAPGVGRFVSPDSVVPGAENPQAFNRYTYALNRPLTLADPTGHFPICIPFLGCFEINLGGITPIDPPNAEKLLVVDASSTAQPSQGQLEPTRTAQPQATGTPSVPSALGTPTPQSTATTKVTQTPTPKPTDEIHNIVVYRVINGTNLGQFKDVKPNEKNTDGMSVFEISPPTGPGQFALPLGLTYQGDKIPGKTIGLLTDPRLSALGLIALYTPNEVLDGMRDLGHWSIAFEGIPTEELFNKAKEALKEYAMNLSKGVKFK